ncbi:hypothetical protein [Niabella drilacis]|uniref:Uncharacterized protein n=1 Tax=Niabella drilacis (strain DSM 25811 / CCM 8410 / CCUG 62505 / LMG 26954 / E90) TaxID=1285928 RepID=A0A1G6PXZ3_NIADE|nr:hypothetical protein [Niabella drilacis]SDC84993.1 hypothetical protein SAMN04487894_104205 [Niabella drilacis]
MKNSAKILLLILVLLFTVPVLFYKVVLNKVKADRPDIYKALTENRRVIDEATEVLKH